MGERLVKTPPAVDDASAGSVEKTEASDVGRFPRRELKIAKGSADVAETAEESAEDPSCEVKVEDGS